MASIVDSVEGHPEYAFDHKICIQLPDLMTVCSEVPRCVAIDSFTDHIYALFVNNKYGSWDVRIYSQSGDFLRSFSYSYWRSVSINGMAIYKNNVYLVLAQGCLHHFIVTDSIRHWCEERFRL